MPELILHNGRITTLDRQRPQASALAVRGGLIQAVGGDDEILPLAGESTRVIDLNGRRAIPGLNDSHTHVIRGGLHYNLELRWDGVTSLADALSMLKAQAQRTRPPQWVRVVGGWSEFQFAERRMPTLAELNAAAPETPVFVLHLYARALLNRAALNALGFDRDTPDPPGGVIERDKQGRPTGLLLAKPSALILYSTLARGPVLGFEDQVNSSRQFQRELNRLGVTSVIDAGGGGQNYPDDYAVIRALHERGQMTTRIAYHLFAQKPGSELDDYQRWVKMTGYGDGDAMLRVNGAGENLTWAAADFENFLEPRPELGERMEGELARITRLLAEKRWPFRIHATYDESIRRFLDVFEAVDRDVPFDGLRWTIDHAETVSPESIERIKALGGGIAVQHRMAFQGEYFVDRYGAEAAEATPPIARMLEMDVPVGAGTDATRVASFNPWVALYWLTEGRTVGGLRLYPEGNRLDRATALRLWTEGSAWFSGEEAHKGRLAPGQYADVAVLSDDYFAVPGERIKDLTSVLTLLGGEVVHGDAEFGKLDPPLPPLSPGWSPVRHYGGYQHDTAAAARVAVHACADPGHRHHNHGPLGAALWGSGGCGCFAF